MNEANVCAQHAGEGIESSTVVPCGDFRCGRAGTISMPQSGDTPEQDGIQVKQDTGPDS